jgi:diaminohydroxyphosphoribosylaminopyrimidine deaminase / 5-amino-6-(5-phosphoribosylamino)uracil reductase
MTENPHKRKKKEDSAWMLLALQEAALAIPLSAPNPRVGCVIVNQSGQLIGKGHTQTPGNPHAEVMALKDCLSHGHDVQGATAYVTLEPCSHHGRTGPCADALIASGISRVVAALEDPNPVVAGRGFQKLRDAKIEVSIGIEAEAAYELNIGFFHRMRTGTPWLRMKAASSLDGKTALPNGSSQWITSELARKDTQYWRMRACAMMTGIGTILHDDPMLTVRSTERQPALLILDRQLRIPLHAKVFEFSRKICIFHQSENKEKAYSLSLKGIELIKIDASNDVEFFINVMSALRSKNFNEIHMESGFHLNSSAIQSGFVNEILLYLAPKWIGQGAGLGQMASIENISDCMRLQIKSVEMIGEDIRVIART